MAPKKTLSLILGCLLALPKLLSTHGKKSPSIHSATPENEGASYELRDASSKKIFKIGLMMLIGGIIMHISLVSLFIVWRHQSKNQTALLVDSRLLVQGALPPQPRLQKNPQQDLQVYFEKETKILNSYGWVDRVKKQVRIPIDRAMELLVERSGNKK